jgi:deoxyadenosine/deoxycytidine kinase
MTTTLSTETAQAAFTGEEIYMMAHHSSLVKSLINAEQNHLDQCIIQHWTKQIHTSRNMLTEAMGVTRYTQLWNLVLGLNPDTEDQR